MVSLRGRALPQKVCLSFVTSASLGSLRLVRARTRRNLELEEALSGRQRGRYRKSGLRRIFGLLRGRLLHDFLLRFRPSLLPNFRFGLRSGLARFRGRNAGARISGLPSGLGRRLFVTEKPLEQEELVLVEPQKKPLVTFELLFEKLV